MKKWWKNSGLVLNQTLNAAEATLGAQCLISIRHLPYISHCRAGSAWKGALLLAKSLLSLLSGCHFCSLHPDCHFGQSFVTGAEWKTWNVWEIKQEKAEEDSNVSSDSAHSTLRQTVPNPDLPDSSVKVELSHWILVQNQAYLIPVLFETVGLSCRALYTQTPHFALLIDAHWVTSRWL